MGPEGKHLEGGGLSESLCLPVLDGRSAGKSALSFGIDLSEE
jgi:hypothetical protein